MSPSHVRNDYKLVPIDGLPAVGLFQFAPPAIPSIKDEGPKLWKELHEAENPNAEWFGAWLQRIPRYGCTCKNDFAVILKDNPPRFDDWKRWTWEVHGAVNRKLGKAEFSWAEFCETYLAANPFAPYKNMTIPAITPSAPLYFTKS